MTFARGQYVVCTIRERIDAIGRLSENRAGLTLYRFANGWVVAMVEGGFRTVLNENMRPATQSEYLDIMRTWDEIDASRGAIDVGALDALTQRVFQGSYKVL